MMPKKKLNIDSLISPFDLDENIFHFSDDDGNIIGESYSYNDLIQEIKNISRVNADLLGPSKRKRK